MVSSSNLYSLKSLILHVYPTFNSISTIFIILFIDIQIKMELNQVFVYFWKKN